ncbi:glycosyltransferase [Pseudoalteromonas sp. T1lg122]|uniref:glycosyltransferase n=1 Tax=Pseudoalteromonas sp. T1lg122 TaxID=2077094 RepID=UPI000CF60680|nr:glycosyltransferase [Pseudoalteromonas sp. T1lg122]
MQEKVSVLFVYSDFKVGGIQTQILEMCKYKNNIGSRGKVLLLSREYDKELLSELKNNADVFFIDELFYPTKLNRSLVRVSSLFIPFCVYDKDKVALLMSEIDACHTTNLYTFYIISSLLLRGVIEPVKLTLGFYHANECKSLPNDPPFYKEVLNTINCLNERSLIATSKRTAENIRFVLQESDPDIMEVSLGVPRGGEVKYKVKNEPLNILSVGRLVSFKTYNLHVLELVNDLVKDGVFVNYKIVGDGPDYNSLTAYVKENKLEGYVQFIKHVNYSDLDAHIDRADVFVGSGTSLVLAAGHSCVCLIGIESNVNSDTYGYLSNTCQQNYHELGLEYPKQTFKSYILDLIDMPQDKFNALRKKEYERSYDFSIERFMNVFDDINSDADIYHGYSFKRFLKLQLELMRTILFDKLIKKRNISKSY